MSAEITYTPEQVFGAARIEKWKEEGHWPPTPGMIVLPQTRANPEGVARLAQELVASLPSKQAKFLQDYFVQHLENFIRPQS